MTNIVRLDDYRVRIGVPVPTPIARYGWRLAWVFQIFPIVGFVPVWVLDWG